MPYNSLAFKNNKDAWGMRDLEQQAHDKPETEQASDQESAEQHPDWHPFAVWKSQIRTEQATAITGEHRIISSAKIADA